MRFTFCVERPTKNTELGLIYSGLDPLYAPLVIDQLVPGGLVDRWDRWKVTGSEPLCILQQDDIILAVNDCTKTKHGRDMMVATLEGDRDLTF